MESQPIHLLRWSEVKAKAGIGDRNQLLKLELKRLFGNSPSQPACQLINTITAIDLNSIPTGAIERVSAALLATIHDDHKRNLLNTANHKFPTMDNKGQHGGWIDHPKIYKDEHGNLTFVSEPYGLSSDDIEILHGLTQDGWDCKILGDSYHFPSSTVRVELKRTAPRNAQNAPRMRLD